SKLLNIEVLTFWHKVEKRHLKAQLWKPLNLKNKKIPLVAFDVGLQYRIWNIPIFACAIAKLGFAVIGTEYSRVEIAKGEIKDIVNAIKFCHENFDFLDNRTFLVGVSMGGATMLNIASKYENELNIKAVIALAPFADLARAYYYAIAFVKTTPKKDPRTGLLKLYLKHVYTVPHINPKEYALRSPSNFVPFINCPVLLIHGKNDKIVPVDHSLELYYKMLYLGKNVELRLVPGEGVHTPLLLREHIKRFNFFGFLQSLFYTVCFLKKFR
ncbi:MAG: alpha/beta hydrolase family protein, partial [Endomicrobiia bacterium]